MAKQKEGSSVLSRIQLFFGLRSGQALPQIAAYRDTSPQSVRNYMNGNMSTQFEEDRIMRYYDYDSMDAASGDITSALDIYAEEATQRSLERDMTVWVTSEDEKVVKSCEELFNRIGMENLIFGMARHLSKYGDLFTFPIVEASGGITKLLFVHPSSIEVVSNREDGKLMGYNCDSLNITSGNIGVGDSISGIGTKEPPTVISDKSKEGFSPWDFIHFSIKGSDLTSDYGFSMIEGARKSWQTLSMLETAIALYRLLRSGSRFVYYIDVGDASPEEAVELVNKYVSMIRTESHLNITDPANRNATDPGDINQYLSRHKPYSMMDDLFYPTTKDSSSKVEHLGGDADVTAIEDVEYFKNKMRVSLGIPKAYFDQDISGWNANKALAQQDIRFSKKIERLQRALVDGITVVCAANLLYEGKKEFKFSVMMEQPSSLALIQKLETWQNKLSIASELMDIGPKFGFNSETWGEYILSTILDMSEDMIEGLKKGAEEKDDSLIDMGGGMVLDPNNPDFDPRAALAPQTPEDTKNPGFITEPTLERRRPRTQRDFPIFANVTKRTPISIREDYKLYSDSDFKRRNRARNL